MFYTRPTCPRCGQKWQEPLAIPNQGLLKQTMEHISRMGGLYCDTCVAEVNQLWAEHVLPTLTTK